VDQGILRQSITTISIGCIYIDLKTVFTTVKKKKHLYIVKRAKNTLFIEMVD